MSLSHEKESMMGKLRLVAGPFVGTEMKQVVFCQSQDFDIKTGKKRFYQTTCRHSEEKPIFYI